ncbi:MAG: hypothetical protein ACOC22_02040 [bacterium]
MNKNENKLPYFAEKEEQAVIDYILSSDIEEKNKIYNEILLEPFRKMKESILRRYPIHIGNYDMGEVESNALTHLIEHMIKYRPYIIEYKNTNSLNPEKWVKMSLEYRFFFLEDAEEKYNELVLSNDDNHIDYRISPSRAFSYCQTIIRNYYKDHSKKSYLEKKINLSYDDYIDEIETSDEYIYEMNVDGEERLEMLINNVVDKIDNIIDSDETLKRNEIIVGDAISNILKNWHILFLEDSPTGQYNKRITNKFAKNKILFYLKEQTGLTTKEIRIAIKPFKEIYFFEKTNFFND